MGAPGRAAAESGGGARCRLRCGGARRRRCDGLPVPSIAIDLAAGSQIQIGSALEGRAGALRGVSRQRDYLLVVLAVGETDIFLTLSLHRY